MMDGWMFGWMWIWPVLVLTSLVVLVLGVVWLVRSQSPRVGNAAAGSSARQILDERFARGEIDEEEYQRRRAQL